MYFFLDLCVVAHQLTNGQYASLLLVYLLARDEGVDTLVDVVQ